MIEPRKIFLVVAIATRSAVKLYDIIALLLFFFFKKDKDAMRCCGYYWLALAVISLDATASGWYIMINLRWQIYE